MDLQLISQFLRATLSRLRMVKVVQNVEVMFTMLTKPSPRAGVTLLLIIFDLLLSNIYVFTIFRCYHKQCFKCTVCKRQLDSRTVCDGPDKDIYCNGKCALNCLVMAILEIQYK